MPTREKILEQVKHWEWTWNNDISRMVNECYAENGAVTDMFRNRTMNGREELRLMEEHMLAATEQPSPPNLDPDSIPARVIDSLELHTDTPNTTGWRTADIPAANGHGNARSVVRAQTDLANGGVAFGKELFSPKVQTRSLESQIQGLDHALGLKVEYAMGYKPNISNE
ncbi:MAG: hypothetical protein OXQ27_07115 [Chloroflexota bacterium]|nr:hypothetical protein [Chloroflexota bacterium]